MDGSPLGQHGQRDGHGRGHLAKAVRRLDSPDPSDCGDGVIGAVYVDGQLKWSASVAADDTQGIDYRLQTDVSVGSNVDFVIDPRAND